MTVIASSEALSKLRQEARRQQQAAELREMCRLRQYTPAPRPTYEDSAEAYLRGDED
jgi:hypothetical protein